MHLLRARLHCHIWTCLEEFSPQTSPSGPNAAHLPSLWACTTHIAIQGSGPAGSPVTKAALLFIVVSPAAGLHTSLSHGPWVGKFFLLGKTPTVIPRGL